MSGTLGLEMRKPWVWLLIGFTLLRGVTGPSLAQSQDAVNIAQNQLGDYLTDAQGHSLYLYLKDEKNTSTCYDQCAKLWPPFLVKDQPLAGKGFGVMDEFYDGRLLGTTRRRDGSLQATINGRPLYYFSGDQSQGEAKGQGIDKTWFLASPRGEPVGEGH